MQLSEVRELLAKGYTILKVVPKVKIEGKLDLSKGILTASKVEFTKHCIVVLVRGWRRESPRGRPEYWKRN